MKTCLIVDDSKIVRRMARRIVGEMGFEVSEAEDGDMALAMCRQSMPTSILLDWNMPNMTGLEFLKLLRKEKKGDAPKVIFCTIENDVSYIKKALRAGADEYIMKPFDSDIIRTKFDQVGLIDG
tara:strand:+ start:2101 stop:2472 length:372 start_codon:yes stop_codon:yes gene_type:complete